MKLDGPWHPDENVAFEALSLQPKILEGDRVTSEHSHKARAIRALLRLQLAGDTSE
jgi:hypothetical protein